MTKCKCGRTAKAAHTPQNRWGGHTACGNCKKHCRCSPKNETQHTRARSTYLTPAAIISCSRCGETHRGKTMNSLWAFLREKGWSDDEGQVLCQPCDLIVAYCCAEEIEA